jgi:hypothetical protein
MAQKIPKTDIKRPGAGRTHGSFSFIVVTLGELNAKFSDPSTPIKVSRKQMELYFPDKATKPVQKLTKSIDGLSPETEVASKVIDFND